MEVAIQAGPDPTLANSRNIKNKPLADLCCECLRVQVSNKTKKNNKKGKVGSQREPPYP